MTHTRRWTRPLIATWPLLVALLAFATISHDVAMAAHTHETPIPAGVVEANIAHAFTGMHEGIPPETNLATHLPTTDSTCPTDSCPDLTDCGLARVSNPIPAPDLHPLATGLIDSASCLHRATKSDTLVSSIEPVHPPGVRRALLQVFLN
jgi:hypothetical protein